MQDNLNPADHPTHIKFMQNLPIDPSRQHTANGHPTHPCYSPEDPMHDEMPTTTVQESRCGSCGQQLTGEDTGDTVAVFPSDLDKEAFIVTVCSKCAEHRHLLPQGSSDEED